MNILLTGAGGFIGQQLLRELLAQGHQLTVCSSRQLALLERYPSLEYCPVDYAQAQSVTDWLPYVQNMDAVINAVGIIDEDQAGQFTELHTTVPIALFKACEQAQCKRVIQISALGADPNANTQYFISKEKADAALQMLDLQWFVIRPSLVYGAAGQSFSMLKALAALPLIPLLGDGSQQLQPVHIDDLVKAVALCLDEKTEPCQVINAVGAEPLSYAKMLAILRRCQGMSQARYLSISPMIWRCLTPLGGWLKEPALNADALSMLESGNTADPKPLTRHLGHQPQTFTALLQDFVPDQAQRWHAQLYFLRPVLRLSLALMWLWAGWVSLFVYPHDQSYQLLAQVGINASFAPLVLYAASTLDFVLGIAMLMNWYLPLVVGFQLLAMLIYTVVITLTLPEFWAHPFGPMIKNLPIAVAIIVLLILEEDSV
jgi:uncharacterized protein YbjT (DUF2867 family)/uncharacterized membrane protein YphA (DoxX/SURF4 family)